MTISISNFKPDKKLRSKKILKQFLYSFIFFFILIGSIAALILIFSNNPANNLPTEIFLIIIYSLSGIWVLIIGLIIILNFLHYKGIEYEITEKAIVIRKGYFTKDEIKIPFSRIKDVKVYCGNIDKIFKIYTVVVESSDNMSEIIIEDKIEGILEYDLIFDKIKDSLKKK